MSRLRSKIYKGRSHGENSGREQGKKRGGGRRRRDQKSIRGRGHGGNVAEADVEMSESQRLEELRKAREQGLRVKYSFILQIFIPAN